MVARVCALLLLVLAAMSPAMGQFIYNDPEVHTIWVAPSREDVKAIGAGRTQIANGLSFNAMMYNPALLARRRTSFDVLSVQAGLPKTTLDALDFLSDPNTIQQIKTAQFVKDVRRGILDLGNAATQQDVSNAIAKINRGLQFARQYQDEMIGSADDPKIHAVSLIPNFQVQVDNIGVSLFGSFQLGFQSRPTEPLTRLYSYQIPPDFVNMPVDQLLAELVNLSIVTDPLFDPTTGEFNAYEAIPQTIALAYVDVVGAVGYGYQLTPALSLGANLKIVNRRFSTKVIDPDHYNGLLKEVVSEFKSSVTGVTLDLGGLYQLKESGTDIGLSLQNIIPLPKAEFTSENSDVVWLDDGTGNVRAYKVFIRRAFEARAPFLVNVGVMHRIMPNWTASFDWVDMASQDEDAYEKYVERFRLGTEYTFWAVPEHLGFVLRGGLASSHVAAGLGINIYRVVQIDGAFAYDTGIGANAFFVQLKIGW